MGPEVSSATTGDGASTNGDEPGAAFGRTRRRGGIRPRSTEPSPGSTTDAETSGEAQQTANAASSDQTGGPTGLGDQGGPNDASLDHADDATGRADDATGRADDATDHADDATGRADDPTDHTDDSTDHADDATDHADDATDHADDATDHADDATDHADREDDGLVGFVAPIIGAAGGVLLLGGLAWWGATRDLSTGVISLLAIGAVMLALYIAIHGRDLIAWGSTRGARRGSAATIQSIAIVGILGVANWASVQYGGKVDLTSAKRYTLADQTRKILGSLDRDVKIIAFFPSRLDGDPFSRGTKALLQEYASGSKRVTIEFIDPEVNPGAARQYDIKAVPVTLFTAGERKEETTGLTEQDFTSALLKLTRTEKKKVYFLQGHQERDPDSAQQGGMNVISQALKRENYLVEKLSLLATSSVPADAAVVVIAGAKVKALEAEVRAIGDFLDAGGHVFFLLEPKVETGFEPLLDRWNVTVGNDLVIDPARNLSGDGLTPAPLPQAGHRISSSLTDVVLPGTRSITPKTGATGANVTTSSLLKTTERGWGEVTLTGAAKFDEGTDLKGPVSVAVAVNRTEPMPTLSPGATPTAVPSDAPKVPKGRAVIVGNAEFASNTLAGQVIGNRDLFVNAVNWLAEEEDLISIRAEPQAAPSIVLTNQGEFIVFVTVVLLVPLSVIAIGVSIWWQRR
jgi:ABC-type uncharacterized transport system involved in gliding motility auxiliary subunit